MKLTGTALLGAALATVAAAAAQASPGRDSEANAAFATYPKESLANGEQGTVRYRVKIDRSGRVTECEVTQSSGYRRLDDATCSLLMDKARFTPARDGRGRTTRSNYEGRVHWRLS